MRLLTLTAICILVPACRTDRQTDLHAGPQVQARAMRAAAHGTDNEPFMDVNQNQIDDTLEIAMGSLLDENCNGIPDIAEQEIHQDEL